MTGSPALACKSRPETGERRQGTARAIPPHLGKTQLPPRQTKVGLAGNP
jgi:hypothetical protein